MFAPMSFRLARSVLLALVSLPLILAGPRDHRTDAFARVGRMHGTQPGCYLVVGPD
jgi:hypothetical protein